MKTLLRSMMRRSQLGQISLFYCQIGRREVRTSAERKLIMPKRVIYLEGWLSNLCRNWNGHYHLLNPSLRSALGLMKIIQNRSSSRSSYLQMRHFLPLLLVKPRNPLAHRNGQTIITCKSRHLFAQLNASMQKCERPKTKQKLEEGRNFQNRTLPESTRIMSLTLPVRTPQVLSFQKLREARSRLYRSRFEMKY